MTPNAAGQVVPTPPTGGPLPPDLDPAVVPNLDDLVTEDQAPVDNMYVEKQYRLFTEPLYTSWAGPGEGRPFLAVANVGWFHTYKQPPLVPDGLLSLDAQPAGDLRTKEGRSYFQWLIGKPPEVVIEIVSDRRGGEEDFKKKEYARLGALFYVIYDPDNLLGGGVLRAFVLQRRKYEPVDPSWFPEVGLGLTLWEGEVDEHHDIWLRWCYRDGRVISTGAERAAEERRRAEEERGRADESAAKLEKLAAQLRALGIEPDVG